MFSFWKPRNTRPIDETATPEEDDAAFIEELTGGTTQNSFEGGDLGEGQQVVSEEQLARELHRERVLAQMETNISGIL